MAKEFGFKLFVRCVVNKSATDPHGLIIFWIFLWEKSVPVCVCPWQKDCGLGFISLNPTCDLKLFGSGLSGLGSVSLMLAQGAITNPFRFSAIFASTKSRAWGKRNLLCLPG